MRKQSLLNPKTSESKLCSMPYGPSDQSYKLKKKPYLKAVLMASLVCQTLIPLACPSKVVAVYPAVFELSKLNQTTGFIINGSSGIGEISSAGDLNGDGRDDIIIGNPDATANGLGSAGQVYVVFGASSFSPIFNISSLNGTNGFILNGLNYILGISVAAAGDINGDGRDDIIISDPESRSTGEGFIYVIFGAPTFPAIFNLSSLNGSNGFTINGIGILPGVGESVAAAGDVNGDGKDDILIGDPTVVGSKYGGEIGQAYVVFGAANFPSSISLSNLNGTNGFTMNGANFGLGTGSCCAGQSVSSAGDINGDGRGDIIIGAPGNAGQSYVVFGASIFPATITLTSLNGTNGFILNGISSTDYSGSTVASVKDFNGDGMNDIIINAPEAMSGAGQVYVIYGAPTFSAVFNLSNINSNNGLTINGMYPVINLGIETVSSAGDFNGDGRDDILIGCRGASLGGTYVGQAYVVYGTPSLPSPFNLSNLNGSNGFTINGINNYGGVGDSVSSAGDINGDGGDDIIIGASGSGANGGAGQAYVLYGAVLPTTTTSTTAASTTKPITSTTSTTLSTSTFLPTTTASTTVMPTTISSSTVTSTTAPPTTMISSTITMLTSTSTSTQPETPSTTISVPQSPISTMLSTMNASTVQLTTPTTTTIPVSTTDGSAETTRVQSTSIATTMNTVATAESVTTLEDTSTTISASSAPQLTAALLPTSQISNITSTSSFNATLQSGGRTTSSASSWTGVIVGATVGVIATIGAGYLAYRKWRGHGQVNPQIKAATVAAMNAIDPAREEDLRMQANPVYEGTTLQQAAGAYEHPHIDTWARDLYDSQENEASATIYGASTIPVRDQAYAALQPVTLNGQGHGTTNLNPQGSAWSAAYDTIHGGPQPLVYETILSDQQPWDESAYDLNLPPPGATEDYIDIVEPLDSRV